MHSANTPNIKSVLSAFALASLLAAISLAIPAAWAQPLQTTSQAAVQVGTLQPAQGSSSIDDVRALIQQLPATPNVVESDGALIAQARKAYDELSADDQRLLDTETNREALGTTQSYGRVLELAEAGYAVLHDVDNSTTLADGIYTTSVNSSWDRGKSASKQDRDWTATRVTVKDGAAFVTLSVNSSTYSYVRASGQKATRSASSASDTSVFTFPVSLGKRMVFVAYSDTMAAEIAYNLLVQVASGATPEADPTDEDATSTPDEDITESLGAPVISTDAATGRVHVEKGTFEHPEIKGYMFRIVAPALVTSDGEHMSVFAMMPSTSYSHLYVGTAAQASQKNLEEGVADGSFIPAVEVENAQGETVGSFTFPLESLDRETSLCLYSVKNQHWVDQTITINSEDLTWHQPLGDDPEVASVIEMLENLPARNTIIPDNNEHETTVRAARAAYDALGRLQKTQIPERLTLLLSWDESMFDLGFNTNFLPLAQVGQPYDGAIYVSGKNGRAGKKARIVDGALPDGLGLAMDDKGLWAQFSGTPKETGTWTFTVELSNDSETVTSPFTIHVGYAPNILTQSIADARIGDAYEQVFSADAYPDATWSLAAGTLPAGLSFADDGESASTARITGTPTEAGTFELTLTCDNFANGMESKTYTLTVLDTSEQERIKALEGTVAAVKSELAATKAELAKVKDQQKQLQKSTSSLTSLVSKLNSAIKKLQAQMPKSVVVNVKTVTAKAVKAALKKARNPYTTTVTLGKNVKTIKKGAFAGTDVRKLVVKTTKLTKKRVKGSLKGSKVTTVQVKVAAKSMKKTKKAYKAAFTKSNAGRKVKIA